MSYMENINQKIDFFFKPPTEEPVGSEFSSLYLLRRDIFTALGHDPNTLDSINYSVLWPGVMCILAGIDLLGKYLKGDDINSTVTKRFKNYYKRYFDNVKECDIVYQLRNSMLHSFGLYSFQTKREGENNVKTKEYRFVIDRNDNPSIVSYYEDDFYGINIKALHEGFEKSINKYFTELKSNKELQGNFEKMFPYYKGIYIGQP